MSAALSSPANTTVAQAAAPLDNYHHQAAAICCTKVCQQLAKALSLAGQPLGPAEALCAAGYMPLMLEAGRLLLELCTLHINASPMPSTWVEHIVWTGATVLLLQASGMRSAFA